MKSRNRFACADFSSALDETLAALAILGVQVNASPTKEEVDVLFEQVKSEILAIGFSEILAIPRANDSRIDLVVQLLNDAGTKMLFELFGPRFAQVSQGQTHFGTQVKNFLM